MQNTDKARD